MDTYHYHATIEVLEDNGQWSCEDLDSFDNSGVRANFVVETLKPLIPHQSSPLWTIPPIKPVRVTLETYRFDHMKTSNDRMERFYYRNDDATVVLNLTTIHDLMDAIERFEQEVPW